MGELAIPTSTYVPSAFYQAYNDQPYPSYSGTKTTLFVVRVDTPKKVEAASSTNGKRSHFSTTLSDTQKALNRLRAFKTWEANWDAEGAAKPDIAMIEVATKVLTLLSLEGVSPTVMLNADGKPMFLVNQWGLDGEIVVAEKDEIEFFFGADLAIGDTVAFAEQSLPTELTQIFKSART